MEAFNHFFTSVFTTENPTSIPALHVDKHIEPIDLSDISPELVFSKLCNLNPYKSHGPMVGPFGPLKRLQAQYVFL